MKAKIGEPECQHCGGAMYEPDKENRLMYKCEDCGKPAINPLLKQAKPMKLELKKVKEHKDMSEETRCFSAELWINGALAATVSNHGTGGDNEYHFKDRKLEEEVYAWVKTLPQRTLKMEGHEDIVTDEDLDSLIDDIIHRAKEVKRIKRLFAHKTPFRVKGRHYEAGAYSMMKLDIDDPKCAEYLDGKYGKDGYVILEAEAFVDELMKEGT